MIEEFSQLGWSQTHGVLAAGIDRAVKRLWGWLLTGPFNSRKDRKMDNALRGQTLVVVGASSGLGHALASLALQQGAHVVGLSRSGAAPKGVHGVAVDVADVAALGSVLQSLGAIDHVAYTAGARTPSTPLRQLGDAALLDAFAPKLFGAIHAVRLALPALSERASITLTSGQVSRKYGTGTLVKGVVNAAVEAAGRHLAKELAPRRVNVVSPGVVDTSLWGDRGSEARTAFLAKVATSLPVGRVGAPEDVAAAYLFAMTNPFINGTLIDVDGGGLL